METTKILGGIHIKYPSSRECNSSYIYTGTQINNSFSLLYLYLEGLIDLLVRASNAALSMFCTSTDVSGNIVRAIFFGGASLKRCLVHIFKVMFWLQWAVVFQDFSPRFGHNGASRDNSSGTSANAPATSSKMKSHDADCCGKNLPNPQLDLRQSAKPQKKGVTITEFFGILVQKSVCCGANPLLHLLCRIGCMAWKKYKSELYSCFAFSFTNSRLVTVVVEHEITEQCSNQN